ncbi:hypothetical protein K1719_036518 [Acacia pycnantha]|nr:hypothetical protein K1719_036518 [Acacia pycnantha]
MGRQPAYGFMLKKLRQIWERRGKIDVFDLENDFYLVNFQHTEDYMGALIGGPWVIADAYLSVSRWKHEFNHRNAKIESLIAWVRFPELPEPLFDKKILLNLGNAIGKAIRLDIHMAQRSRGKFARIKDGCDVFHKTKAEEGMEVEVQGEEKKDDVLREEAGLGVKETNTEVPETSEAPEHGPRVKVQNNHSKMGKTNGLGAGSNRVVNSRKDPGSRGIQVEKK